MAALEQDSQRRLHLLKQSNPKEFPTGAKPLVMTSLNLKRQRPDQARTSHRPMGYNAAAWHALLRHFETFSGDVAHDYRQIVPLLEMVFGAPVVTTSEVTVKGVTKTVRRREFLFPESELPALIQYAAENGYLRAAKRLLYGLCPALGLNVKRGNTPSISGSTTLMFGAPQKNADGSENFAMSGGVAGNHKTRIVAANATGPLVLSIVAPGVAAKAVSLAIGDTVQVIKDKFSAVGLTVAVAGTIATGAGQVDSFGGTGPFPAINGKTPNAALATSELIRKDLEDQIRTFRAGAVVAGTFTKAVAGKVTSYTLSGAGSAAANGTYTETAANSNPTVGVALFTNPNGSVAYIANANGSYKWAHGPDLSNTDYYISQNYASLAAAVAAGPIVSFVVGFNGSAPVPTGTVTAQSGGTPASITNATITYPASAGNLGAVAIVNPAGASYTGTTTAPGGAGGTVDLEFTNPTNTAIAVDQTGGTGYALQTTQQGGDGQLRAPEQYPVLPQHFSYRVAEKLAQLEAAPPLKGVHETDLQLSNVVEPDQVFAEGELGYQNHVGGDIEVKAKLVLVSDELEPNSDVQKFRDYADAAPARALWHQNKASHPDGFHSLGYAGRFAVSDPYTPTAGGKVFQYEFEMELELNSELKMPDGRPAILRIVQTEPLD